eukprot:14266340-Heterocapsa_arctica.AAC.1
MGSHQHSPTRSSPELTDAVLIRVDHAEPEARTRKGLRLSLRDSSGGGPSIGWLPTQPRGCSQRAGG